MASSGRRVASPPFGSRRGSLPPPSLADLSSRPLAWTRADRLVPLHVGRRGLVVGLARGLPQLAPVRARGDGDVVLQGPVVEGPQRDVLVRPCPSLGPLCPGRLPEAQPLLTCSRASLAPETAASTPSRESTSASTSRSLEESMVRLPPPAPSDRFPCRDPAAADRRGSLPSTAYVIDLRGERFALLLPPGFPAPASRPPADRTPLLSPLITGTRRRPRSGRRRTCLRSCARSGTPTTPTTGCQGASSPTRPLCLLAARAAPRFR